jgi:hypothetical protein
MERRRSTADDKGRILPTTREQLIRKPPQERTPRKETSAEYVAGADGTAPVEVPKSTED